ncbi:phosphatidylglycerophosphatase A [Oxalobacteraceae bacterium GrIS 2.11]
MNNVTDVRSKVKPNAAFMLSSLHHFIAQGFGSGLSPIMPGTVGTLLAWAMYVVMTNRWPGFFTESHWAWIIGIGFFVGILVCEKTGQALGVSDHGSMVWDEIIAMWLVLLLLMPADFVTQCWAFFWFRFFDMVKPPPISYFDQHLKGGFGVMWDDIVAAFYTLLLFTVWRLI